MSKVIQLENKILLDGYCQTKVVTMGNITELTVMKKPALGPPVVKIDKDHYVDKRSGEVFQYDHIANRSESIDSIRKTLAYIRALINTNVTVPENCRWVTLTYRQREDKTQECVPMTDSKRLYEDYRRFWLRFCYWCSSNGHGKPEYITVQEPQGSGSWHIHAFFIWSSKAPFIPNDAVMSKLWGQGFPKTKAVTDCDNAGAYFTAYLADMPLDEVQQLSISEQHQSMSGNEVLEKEFQDDDGNVKKKKFVKGGRLFLYPSGMNIVRKTKGIKLPVVERMYYSEAQKKVSAATETFSRSYEIVDEAGETLNYIHKSYYNSKRK